MDTEPIYSFGEWVKRRRKGLRLTQREVADRAHCSVAMIKKIEADERQPSPELAELLAEAVHIPPEQQAPFIEAARGLRPVDQLAPAGEVSFPGRDGLAPQRAVGLQALPQMATPFIGREEELNAISKRLLKPECRLLTLLGPGGIGKTRLATEAALRLESAFGDGPVFVTLASVATVQEIPAAIARGLNLALSGGEPVPIQLQHFLGKRELLLVLDNFEHLVGGAALLSELLKGTPRLKILTTSRERLNVVGEWLYAVPGFAAAPAAQLFTLQARRVRPDFEVAGQEEAIGDICRLVGGHPLAVELAASWTRLMAPPQIAAQIAQDLDFLSGGARDLPARHQSLRALFEHSWELLSPAERDGLARLSVFHNGFAQAQAAAVAGLSWPLLLGLADKSLVQALPAEEQGDQRFDLHALTRQFALAKLAESGARQAALEKHFQTFRHLARELGEQRIGPQAIGSAQRFEDELDNFHAALAYGLEEGRVDEVLAMAEDIFFGWLRGGHWQAGERWLEAAIDQSGEGDNALLCSGLFSLATLRAIQSRYEEARPLAARAVPMAQRLGDPWLLVLANNLIGQSSATAKEMTAAYERVFAICREHMVFPFTLFMSDALRLYGDRLRSFGHYAEAETQYQECLAIFRSFDDAYLIAYPLGCLGRMALLDGNLEKAEELISESVRYVRRGSSRVAMADWLFRLGVVHLYQGEVDAAEADLQEAAALYEEIGSGRGYADVTACLAEVALAGGDQEQAEGHVQSCFTYYRDLLASLSGSILEDYGFDSADDVIANMLRAGLVKTAAQEWENAAALFTYMVTVQARLNHRVVRSLQERVERAEETVRQNLAPAMLRAARERGEGLNVRQAVAFILA